MATGRRCAARTSSNALQLRPPQSGENPSVVSKTCINDLTAHGDRPPLRRARQLERAPAASAAERRKRVGGQKPALAI
jgi:hypothetical protein